MPPKKDLWGLPPGLKASAADERPSGPAGYPHRFGLLDLFISFCLRLQVSEFLMTSVLCMIPGVKRLSMTFFGESSPAFFCMPYKGGVDAFNLVSPLILSREGNTRTQPEKDMVARGCSPSPAISPLPNRDDQFIELVIFC